MMARSEAVSMKREKKNGLTAFTVGSLDELQFAPEEASKLLDLRHDE
jgi:hypothetical protein